MLGYLYIYTNVICRVEKILLIIFIVYAKTDKFIDYINVLQCSVRACTFGPISARYSQYRSRLTISGRAVERSRDALIQKHLCKRALLK